MHHYLSMLRVLHNQPQTFQSNHFRGNAGLYAEAASRGHITALDSGFNSGKWKLTASGLDFLYTYGEGNA